MRNVSLYNRLNSLCRRVARPNCCLYPLKEKSYKEWEALAVLFIILALIRLRLFVCTFESGGRCKNSAIKESEHHVSHLSFSKDCQHSVILPLSLSG